MFGESFKEYLEQLDILSGQLADAVLKISKVFFTKRFFSWDILIKQRLRNGLKYSSGRTTKRRESSLVACWILKNINRDF